MNKQHRLKTILTLAAAITAGFLYASGDTPEGQSVSENPISTEEIQPSDESGLQEGEEDLLSPAQIALNAMTDQYKILRELQYEGEEETSL